ncbi:MAG: glycosyltransferase family 2 protein [Chitinophagaceae bacterium]|nr:glycosyltransferase family 2 protein [Chitinophagaceae bacterium]
MIFAILFLYFFSLFILFLFGLSQFYLAFVYKTRKNNAPIPTAMIHYPKVTIQLPIYNELYIVEKLIDNIVLMDYPRERLEIQILDDSTDETKDILLKKTQEYRAKGIPIQYIRREGRGGFKAGALQNGLLQANGEFIAIFDADFLPEKDFLTKVLGYFSDTNIGMVQTRWSYLNAHSSLLTKLQAFGLDAHFTVEQNGRQLLGGFINFNGTAGVWRKECILSSGGWSSDTLTEDLDLSYKAQMQGWKFLYIEDVQSPSELPVYISAIKSQQYRWNKGAAETSKKYIKKIWHHNMLLVQKIVATAHLFNSGIFPFIMLTVLLTFPAFVIKNTFPSTEVFFHLSSFFFLGFGCIFFFYYITNKKRNPKKSFLEFLGKYIVFITVFMGLSLHNSIAVIEGWIGRKTPFYRTPKCNIDIYHKNTYVVSSLNLLTGMEGIIMLYLLVGIIFLFLLEEYVPLLFQAIACIGFGYIFSISLIHSLRIKK